uniref:Uncharacterized protein n=1 Tax=Arundo donax TaxID=35708 RepID=A0A0A9C7B2_ARUDO
MITETACITKIYPSYLLPTLNST